MKGSLPLLCYLVRWICGLFGCTRYLVVGMRFSLFCCRPICRYAVVVAIQFCGILLSLRLYRSIDPVKPYNLFFGTFVPKK